MVLLNHLRGNINLFSTRKHKQYENNAIGILILPLNVDQKMSKISDEINLRLMNNKMTHHAGERIKKIRKETKLIIRNI